jgi:hypothetical protein
LDLGTPHVPKNGRNGNQGSKLAYFVLAWSFLTGLNGAFLSMVFRIFVDWGYNREWAVLRAGKPACLEPVWEADLLVDQTCLLIGRGSGELDFLGLMAGTKKRNNQRYGKTP